MADEAPRRKGSAGPSPRGRGSRAAHARGRSAEAADLFADDPPAAPAAEPDGPPAEAPAADPAATEAAKRPPRRGRRARATVGAGADDAAASAAPLTAARAARPPEPDPLAARKPQTKPKKPIDPAEDPRGHRDRVRQRYADKGADALADYEFVELILFRVIRQGDVKPTAKRLLDAFGSVGAMLAAPEEALLAVKGVGPKVVEEFRFLHAVALRAAREGVARREVLSSWDEVLAYCRIAMAGKAREEFRILLLDKKNRLIHDEVQQVGTVDHTPVYPREVVALALKTHASAVILVHNHPSGDPTPSSADVRMTKQLVDIATPLGIRVHDHIVIGRDGTASLRGLGLM